MQNRFQLFHTYHSERSELGRLCEDCERGAGEEQLGEDAARVGVEQGDQVAGERGGLQQGGPATQPGPAAQCVTMSDAAVCKVYCCSSLVQCHSQSITAGLLQMCCPHHVLIVSYLAARQERKQWGSQSQGQAGVEVRARESEVNTPASIPALRSADCTGLAATGILSDRFRHNTQYDARTTFHY